MNSLSTLYNLPTSFGTVTSSTTTTPSYAQSYGYSGVDMNSVNLEANFKIYYFYYKILEYERNNLKELDIVHLNELLDSKDVKSSKIGVDIIKNKTNYLGLFIEAQKELKHDRIYEIINKFINETFCRI